MVVSVVSLVLHARRLFSGLRPWPMHSSSLIYADAICVEPAYILASAAILERLQ